MKKQNNSFLSNQKHKPHLSEQKMTNLLDGSYLCQITGKDVEVLEEEVLCSAVQETGDCQKSLPNMTGCSVYVDSNRAYIQSQSKCTAEIFARLIEESKRNPYIGKGLEHFSWEDEEYSP